MSEYIRNETLIKVLSKMIKVAVIRADYQNEQLHGGTVGDVRLVTGVAESADGRKHPYKVVLKVQRKWERYNDPGSWRREYDFYVSDFGKLFTDSLRWPECYLTEFNDDEIRLWLEYIDGVTGLDLTVDMYVRAAEEWGRFQGRLCAGKPDVLKTLTNLSKIDYAKNFYLHYRSYDVVYDYIRSDKCELPMHLRQMLIGVDENSDEIFNRIEKLPLVLCHRDFWVTNIFSTEDGIRLIDWDTAGWGYLGEDMASLIADEADVDYMVEIYQKCVPAYYKGFSEYAVISHVSDDCVHELILCMFGYRIIEWYLDAESPEGKTRHLYTLQKIYEMKGSGINNLYQ